MKIFLRTSTSFSGAGGFRLAESVSKWGGWG
jgi:hypothetical protein